MPATKKQHKSKRGRKPKPATLISMKFPTALLQAVDEARERMKLDRTAFFEQAAVQFLAANVPTEPELH